jgi:hypothetical protein
MQDEDELLPEKGLYVPGGHAVHAAAVLLPETVLKVPAGQAVMVGPVIPPVV